jgi:hypothetical protein
MTIPSENSGLVLQFAARPHTNRERFRVSVIEDDFGQWLETRSSTSLFFRPRVCCIDRGPTGGPELLCVLDHRGADQGYWYGYVCRHPGRNIFVSLIVLSTAYVDGDDRSSLFARFDYWMRKRLKYEPAIADGFDSVYLESRDFASAASALKTLIANRTATDVAQGVDTRLIDIFGMESFKDLDGCYPPCP